MEVQTVALEMFKKLFAKDNTEVKRFKTNKLKYLEQGDLRFIEQNPDKPSTYAKMAREGHQVMWVINYKTNKYLARVVDGTFTPV